VVEDGDLDVRVAPNSVLFLSRTSKLGKKRGGGINTPPRNVSVAAARGRIIQPRLAPDNPAARLSGLLLEKSGQKIRS
jgi:hypothetical protein